MYSVLLLNLYNSPQKCNMPFHSLHEICTIIATRKEPIVCPIFLYPSYILFYCTSIRLNWSTITDYSILWHMNRCIVFNNLPCKLILKNNKKLFGQFNDQSTSIGQEIRLTFSIASMIIADTGPIWWQNHIDIQNDNCNIHINTFKIMKKGIKIYRFICQLCPFLSWCC